VQNSIQPPRVNPPPAFHKFVVEREIAWAIVTKQCTKARYLTIYLEILPARTPQGLRKICPKVLEGHGQ
jgi:hypothetical protein